jgi:hypothetical protein
MLSNIVQKDRKKFYRLSSVIGLGLLFLLCSCITSNYGKLQPSPEITKIFDDDRILSDHSYYYSGLQGVPDAIVGIQSNYSLKSKRWQQVDLTSLLLRKWVDRMAYVHMVTPRGAWVLGPDGNRIGVWYSARHQATVRVEQGNRVVIFPPLPPELRGVP